MNKAFDTKCKNKHPQSLNQTIINYLSAVRALHHGPYDPLALLDCSLISQGTITLEVE